MNSGWQVKKLEEVCSIELGKTPSRSVASYWDDNKKTQNIWISIADLPHNHQATIYDSKEYLSDSGASLCKIVKKGTLLLSFKLSIGRLAYAGCDLYTNEAIAALTIKNESAITKEYLSWYLTFFDWNKASEGEEKVKGKTLNKAKLRELDIMLPPLPEQQRIVAVLDEAFTEIATATDNTKKNLQNARELFESHLQSIFTTKGDGWVENTLGDVCTFENGDRGTNYPSKSARTAIGIPFINAGHLTDDGIDMDGMDYISRERFNLLGNGKIRPDDILFCLRGSLGKVASVGSLAEGAIASSLVIIRPKASVSGAFLLSYLKSHLCADMISEFRNGAAQPNLSAGSLKKFSIPIPPLPEQQRIVAQLDTLATETKRLKAIYQQKLNNLAALKQSILQKAFADELHMDRLAA